MLSVSSYELVRPKEWEWGSPDANGSWTGMLGLLQREVRLSRCGGAGVTQG